jgi:hypothetical protein
MAVKRNASPPDGEDAFAAAVARLRQAAAGLPEVTEGTWYGTPALKAAGKGLCRIKDADTIALMCPMEDKVFLLEAAPDIYFETDHSKVWPAILVRIHAISDEELAGRIAIALRMQAAKASRKPARDQGISSGRRPGRPR